MAFYFKHFGQLVSSTRERANLTREQLAKMIGYANLHKGANRIARIEDGAGDYPLQTSRILKVLEISDESVERAMQLDQEAQQKQYLKAIKTPIEPELAVRLIPGFIANITLPKGVTDHAQLEEYACTVAKHYRAKSYLVLPNRIGLSINEAGEVCSINEPDAAGEPYLPGTRLKNARSMKFFVEFQQRRARGR